MNIGQRKKEMVFRSRRLKLSKLRIHSQLLNYFTFTFTCREFGLMSCIIISPKRM